VRFASLSVSVFPLPAVTLHKLEVADDPRFGAAPFLTMDSGRLRLRLRPLLTGRVEFAELVLANPVITVVRDAAGRLNVATLGAATEPRASTRPPRPGAPGAVVAPALLPATLKIDGGVLVYVAHGQRPTPRQYRIERLDLTVKTTGPQLAYTGTAHLTPGDVALTIADGLLTLGPGRPLAEAAVRATVTFDTDDVGPLAATVMGAAASITGPVKGTLAVAGTVGATTASGDVKLTKLAIARTSPKCPEPRRRTLAIPSLTLASAWRDGRFTAEPLAAQMPKGTITARLTADVTHGMRVRLDDLTVKGLPVESVLVDFLCQGYAITGPLDLTGALAFAAARPLETLSGPGSLKIGAGKIVGREALSLIGGVVRVGGTISSLLSADLPASTFGSPVEFDAITGTYQITDGVAKTRDLLYTSRAMKVAVAGDFSLASGAMNLDVILNHGRGEVRAKVTGTAASPAIRIVPDSVLRNIDEDTIETSLRDLLKRFR
jgi:uncharacterized protein involved in outer membrane biogenesis